jgi:hypothetical protein
VLINVSANSMQATTLRAWNAQYCVMSGLMKSSPPLVRSVA